MKTILFFDRCELTDLYIGMSKYLKNDFNILHIAYSDVEEKALYENGIIENVINLRYEISEIIKAEEIDLNLLKEIDDLIIKMSSGRFCLNSSIQSDRGFSELKYDDTLILSQVYYKFWKNIFESNIIHYIFHEPPSLYFNHICSLLSKQNDAIYIWLMTTLNENDELSYLYITYDDYNAIELNMRYQKFLEEKDKVDILKCKNFLINFRKKYDIHLGNQIATETNLIELFMRSIKEGISKRINIRKNDPLIDYIDHWMLLQNNSTNRIKNLIGYKKINFQEIDENDLYYYYSMHLEPEATVLYLGDGIYRNQIKLIENIAASLPIGVFLYVKDHPHDIGYRSVEDYIKLQNIPNIKLLKTEISGKKVIRGAIGVFSINGTAGFEAMLLGKQVYTFGNSFYTICNRVVNIKNIRDLREILYKNGNIVYEDDFHLYSFINAFLDSSHKGIVDFFRGRGKKYNVDLDSNYKQIANDFTKFSQIF